MLTWNRKDRLTRIGGWEEGFIPAPTNQVIPTGRAGINPSSQPLRSVSWFKQRTLSHVVVAPLQNHRFAERDFSSIASNNCLRSDSLREPRYAFTSSFKEANSLYKPALSIGGVK